MLTTKNDIKIKKQTDVEKEKKYFFQTYNRLPLVVEKGEGVYLYTNEGKYLDLVGGLAVNILGYSNEKVNNAIIRQIGKYNHLSNVFYQTTQIEFAEKLLTLSGFDRVFLASTGTESIEGAIKLVRKYFQSHSNSKTQLISFLGGFHGRTYGSLSLTPKEKYRKGYSPFLFNIAHLPYNSIKMLESEISDETAGVFLEFIQGEGGVVQADPIFINKLNELKKKYGFLIVADCIQCGAGRTGKFISPHHYDCDIDICVIAKGIGGGLPLSAIMVKEYLSAVWNTGDHGTTFGGNPVACAAGNVVLNELKSGLMENAKKTGEYLKKALLILQLKYSEKIKEVRGMGLMIGVKLMNIDPKSVVKNLFENKIIVSLVNDNVIRLLPPLILKKEDADLFLYHFKESLKYNRIKKQF